ncbi:MAG: hypothetical protein ACRCXK_04945 [Wohlfahrtiimonas sp.]
MDAYKVKGSPILHDGHRYGIGQRIELTKADAEKLSVFLIPLEFEQASKEDPETAAIHQQSELDQSQPDLASPAATETPTESTADHSEGTDAQDQLDQNAIVHPTDEEFEAVKELWTNDQVKAVLDANNIEYKKNGNKRELMTLAWHLPLIKE